MADAVSIWAATALLHFHENSARLIWGHAFRSKRDNDLGPNEEHLFRPCLKPRLNLHWTSKATYLQREPFAREKRNHETSAEVFQHEASVGHGFRTLTIEFFGGRPRHLHLSPCRLVKKQIASTVPSNLPIPLTWISFVHVPFPRDPNRRGRFSPSMTSPSLLLGIASPVTLCCLRVSPSRCSTAIRITGSRPESRVSVPYDIRKRLVPLPGHCFHSYAVVVFHGS